MFSLPNVLGTAVSLLVIVIYDKKCHLNLQVFYSMLVWCLSNLFNYVQIANMNRLSVPHNPTVSDVKMAPVRIE